ncbi:hypothetical protein Pcinc_016666 [Petrolisthes cinctipes]|uniref:Uncharacterized protein n=1 Tax=Petrolisthes cinctipes TaxID=88211 RepID=A0AAE1FRU5_PETCI|nr:hypothetical protein Pcinc_016666 [Petrolisthes cinctipes]
MDGVGEATPRSQTKQVKTAHGDVVKRMKKRDIGCKSDAKQTQGSKINLGQRATTNPDIADILTNLQFLTIHINQDIHDSHNKSLLSQLHYKTNLCNGGSSFGHGDNCTPANHDHPSPPIKLSPTHQSIPHLNSSQLAAVNQDLEDVKITEEGSNQRPSDFLHNTLPENIPYVPAIHGGQFHEPMLPSLPQQSALLAPDMLNLPELQSDFVLEATEVIEEFLQHQHSQILAMTVSKVPHPVPLSLLRHLTHDHLESLLVTLKDLMDIRHKVGVDAVFNFTTSQSLSLPIF